METNKRYPMDVGARLLGVAMTLILCIAEASGASIFHRQCFDTDAFNLERVTSPDGSESYSRIYWRGLDQTAEVPGTPELPVKYIHMLVPADACNFSVRLTEVSLNEASILADRIYPVQIPVSINEYDPNAFNGPDMSKYDGWRSDVSAEIVNDTWIEGRHHIVTIGLHPMAYSSDMNQMQLCSEMTIELQYEQSASPTRIASGMLGSRPSIADISNMVVNSDALDNGMMRATSFESSSSEYPICYYIISERNLLPAMRDLVALKSQKGYKVITKAIEDIYSDKRYKIGASSEIVDDAASLRCYLRDEFEKNGSFFCLLVGDHKTKMPIRKVYYKHEYNDKLADNFNGQNYVPTDVYFSDLGNDKWEATKDTFGNISVEMSNVSFNPCIYIGRLLCHSNEQINNYISKLISYELNPGNGDTDYLDKSAIILQYGFTYGYDTIIDDLNSIFSSTDEVFDSHYDNSNIVYPTGNDVIKILQNTGFCSLSGHGEPTTIACYGKMNTSTNWEYISALQGYDKTKGLSNIDHVLTDNGLDLMKNYGSPGILYSIACDPASFDILTCSDIVFDAPHTVASSYTVGGLYGGVAFLGNTRSGYRGASDDMEKEFLKLLKNNPKIGVSEAVSKLVYSDTGDMPTHARCTHNLIGDPEFEIWKSSPSKINTHYYYLDNKVNVITNETEEWTAVLYDGIGNSKCVRSVDAASPSSIKSLNLTYIGEGDKMQAIGIYGTGRIPVTALKCTSQDLKEVNKSFVVTEAIIGSDAENIGSVTIGENANLTIRAADNIKCKSNVLIQDKGFLELQADNEISMTGASVQEGGKAHISSKKVTCNTGFSVQKGARISINNK